MEHINDFVEVINSYSLAESETTRIVVIDDETSVTALLAVILREEGYEVQVAYDGRRGLELIKTVRPHLVVCDIMLPLMSGLDVVSAMYTSPALHSIPVILMSAGLRPARLDFDRSLQRVEYIPKPFDLQNLLDLIERKLLVDDRVA